MFTFNNDYIFKIWNLLKVKMFKKKAETVGVIHTFVGWGKILILEIRVDHIFY